MLLQYYRGNKYYGEEMLNLSGWPCYIVFEVCRSVYDSRLGTDLWGLCRTVFFVWDGFLTAGFTHCMIYLRGFYLPVCCKDFSLYHFSILFTIFLSPSSFLLNTDISKYCLCSTLEKKVGYDKTKPQKRNVKLLSFFKGLGEWERHLKIGE